MKTLAESVDDLRLFEENTQPRSRINKVFASILFGSVILLCVAFYVGWYNNDRIGMITLFSIGIIAFMSSPLTFRDSPEVIREDLEWWVKRSALESIQEHYHITEDQIVDLHEKECLNKPLVPILSFTYYDFKSERSYELDFAFDENLEPVLIKSDSVSQELVDELKKA